MSEEIIWALDQSERCIACLPAPVANAVVLHLSEGGDLGRESVAEWAAGGVMAAGVVWRGASTPLSDDDWLDLEDAVKDLRDLAKVVAVVGEGAAGRVAQELGERDGSVGYGGPAHVELVIAHLHEVSPV